MAVYRPKYRDLKTGKLIESATWWYEFNFAGRRIRESSQSSKKTIALAAQKNRRDELERSFNGITDTRRERVRPLSELAAEYLQGYIVRHPRSATFVSYAVGHLTKHFGKEMVSDITADSVKDYQTKRLEEKASAKSINEEVGILLRLLGEQGDFIRAKLRRQKALKLTLKRSIAKAFSAREKAALLAEARNRRSPAIYPALVLALNCGLRDAEIRDLTWSRVDLNNAILTVGDSKTEAGEGRRIPLNSDVLAALVEHAKWYLEKFGETRPEWYLFPFGKPQPTNPAKPTTTFKTVWAKIKSNSGIQGRWHDNRHTFITDIAQSGEAGDETIRQLAGHVSKQMLQHYSHISMEAKKRAVAALVKKPETDAAFQDKGLSTVALPQESPKVSKAN